MQTLGLILCLIGTIQITYAILLQRRVEQQIKHRDELTARLEQRFAEEATLLAKITTMLDTPRNQTD